MEQDQKQNFAPQETNPAAKTQTGNVQPAATVPAGAENTLPATKPAPTVAQRWLLLGTVMLGIALRVLLNSDGYLNYAIFWGLALALYLCYAWREIKSDRTAWALIAATAALLVLFPHISAGASGKDYEHYSALYLLGGFAIPCLLMLLPVYVLQKPARQREGALVVPYLAGWFVKPFSAIGRAFAAVGALGKNRGGIKAVLIGLAVGLPLTAAVTALLASADAGMERLVGGLLERLNVFDTLWTIVIAGGGALLFYSYFYNHLWGKPRAYAYREGNWPAAAVCVVAGLLIAVYAVFAAVQFRYLFGGRLPGELTYSEYAREGFWQLIAVAAINFTVFALCLRYAKPSPFVTAAQWGLLAATAMLLASAISRMLLYIGAYGLTMMRILPLWFMAYLAVTTVLCAVRMLHTKLPLLRVGFFTLLYWYVALNIPEWAAIIRTFNAGMGA